MEEADASFLQNPVTKSWVAARYSLIDEAGTTKRRCKYGNCQKEYSRGTSHMILKRHWAKQHSEQFTTQTTPEGRTRTISISCHQNSNPDQNIDNNNKPKKKKNRPNSTQHIVPLKSSHNSNNKSALDKSQPDGKLVAKRLKEAPGIHLTFDIYGGKKGGKVFGIITAHSFADCDIQSVLLEYKHLPYPNDATSIVEFLRSCISKFNIREKIVSITSGCSEYVTGSLMELDKKLKISKNFNFTSCSIRCFPQFVHLHVIEVLKTQEAMIEQLRRIVGMINISGYVCIHQVHQENVNIESVLPVPNHSDSKMKAQNSSQNDLKLLTDSKSNSWNSTLEMIENFLQHREVVLASIHCLQNSTQPQLYQDFTFDWDKLYNLFQLLKPVQDVIKRFVVDNYAPLSIVSSFLQPLINHFSRQWYSPDLDMAAHNFKIQLELYRQTYMNDLTTVATILDPRIKASFIAEKQRAEISNLLRSKFINPILNPTRKIAYASESIFNGIFMDDLDEVDHYLDSPRSPGSVDTLHYWEAHKDAFPNLYALAKVLLCVQATSVPYDRMFSAAENLDKERKVHMDTSESKELMKSWANYLKKK